jgi:hypothetical protein
MKLSNLFVIASIIAGLFGLNGLKIKLEGIGHAQTHLFNVKENSGSPSDKTI